MKNSTIIGFAGPKGSGKSSISESLEIQLLEKGFSVEVAAYADPLKECLMSLFDMTYDQFYTQEGKERVDERYGVSPRVLMQHFGTEFVRKLVPDLWVTLMKKRIDNSVADIFIVEDVRFDDEADLLRSYKTASIYIVERPSLVTSKTFLQRVIAATIKPFSKVHKSERGITKKPKDIVLVNDIEDLSHIHAVAQNIASRFYKNPRY
jgi:glycyl-tRNA synthetase alpha subunit